MNVRERELKTTMRIITPVFLSFCERKQLSPTATAADKHGSTVWEATWHSEGLQRAIHVAVADISEREELMEFGYAAEDGRRYVTRVIGFYSLLSNDGVFLSGGIVARDAYEPCQSTDLKDIDNLDDVYKKIFPAFVEKHLHRAFYEALSVKSEDLTEIYPFPRG